jgi:hypothetical protein
MAREQCQLLLLVAGAEYRNWGGKASSHSGEGPRRPKDLACGPAVATATRRWLFVGPDTRDERNRVPTFAPSSRRLAKSISNIQYKSLAV